MISCSYFVRSVTEVKLSPSRMQYKLIPLPVVSFGLLGLRCFLLGKVTHLLCNEYVSHGQIL